MKKKRPASRPAGVYLPRAVASDTECTGLTPTPPTDEAQAESYADILDLPLPGNEPPDRLERRDR